MFMNAKIYYDQDANLSLMQSRVVAVIGYGSQGHAHALNLRDSGVHVVVGIREGASRERARRDGLQVMDVADAVKAAAVIQILAPDHVQPDLYRTEIAPHLRAGPDGCAQTRWHRSYAHSGRWIKWAAVEGRAPAFATPHRGGCGKCERRPACG